MRMYPRSEAHLIVGSVYENLVHNLEETGHVGNLAIDHTFGLRVPDPHRLRDLLYAADVGVRSFENVLELRELNTTVER